jgi:hypothetical protein
MAELQVDKTEIGLIMMGLNSLDDAQLTKEGKDARARLAFKLGAASADLFVTARTADGGTP